MAKYWTIISANMRDNPSLNAKKIVTIPTGKIVDVLNISPNWAFVNWGKYSGWVYFPLLELYIEENPHLEFYIDIVPIDESMLPSTIQTGRQYVLVDGKTKVNYNLCGQFCAAYVGKDGIKDFLEKWKVSSPYNYNATVTKDKGTGIPVVRDMLKLYRNPDDVEDFREGLRDVIGGILVSPRRIMEKLRTHDCIVGVKIDSKGRIKSGGVGHWVCIEDVEPYGIEDGLVTVYNPFPNTYEKIGYEELMASMKNWSGLTGLWVKKDLEVKDVTNSSIG